MLLYKWLHQSSRLCSVIDRRTIILCLSLFHLASLLWSKFLDRQGPSVRLYLASPLQSNDLGSLPHLVAQFRSLLPRLCGLKLRTFACIADSASLATSFQTTNGRSMGRDIGSVGGVFDRFLCFFFFALQFESY